MQIGRSAVSKIWYGASVALSSDGNTALIAGYANQTTTAAGMWVFTRFGSTWKPDGKQLTASNDSDDGAQGSNVAISGDGKTAFMGSPGFALRSLNASSSATSTVRSIAPG